MPTLRQESDLPALFELLEKILHAFTLRNLLLAGHVDQAFSTTIQSSPFHHAGIVRQAFWGRSGAVDAGDAD